MELVRFAPWQQGYSSAQLYCCAKLCHAAGVKLLPTVLLFCTYKHVEANVTYMIILGMLRSECLRAAMRCCSALQYAQIASLDFRGARRFLTHHWLLLLHI